MGRNVGVALLVTLIFLNVMEIISTENNSAVHLGAHNLSREDASSDGHISSEWALLINIFSFDSLLWSLEAKAYIFVPPITSLSWNLSSLATGLLVSAMGGNIVVITSISEHLK